MRSWYQVNQAPAPGTAADGQKGQLQGLSSLQVKEYQGKACRPCKAAQRPLQRQGGNQAPGAAADSTGSDSEQRNPGRRSKRPLAGVLLVKGGENTRGKPAGRKKPAQRPRRGIDGRQRSGRAAADTRNQAPAAIRTGSTRRRSKRGQIRVFPRAGEKIPGKPRRRHRAAQRPGKWHRRAAPAAADTRRDPDRGNRAQLVPGEPARQAIRNSKKLDGMKISLDGMKISLGGMKISLDGMKISGDC